MNQKTIAIVGAGRLGKTLGALIKNNTAYHLGGIYSPSSAKAACEFIGAGIPVSNLLALPKADLYLITTPDAYLVSTTDVLCQQGLLKPGDIVLHCSGLHPAALLQSARTAGCAIASIHPMQSFADPTTAVKQFAGTYCAFEGDDACYIEIKSLFEALGAIVFTLSSEKKALYHIAGVFASNYVVTLYAKALQLLQQAKVDATVSADLLQTILQGTLRNLSHTKDPKDALTGPLCRGDVASISHHLQTLQHQDLAALYALLGEHTLPLTDLSEEKKQEIKNLLHHKISPDGNGSIVG